MEVWYRGIKLSDLDLEIIDQVRNLLPPTRDLTIEPDTIDGSFDQGTYFDDVSFSLKGKLVCDSIPSIPGRLEQIAQLFQDIIPDFLVEEDHQDRGLLCVRDGTISAPYSINGIDIDIPLTTEDPFWYSLVEHSQLGGGTIVNSGDKSTGFLITVVGPSTNPKITINGVDITYTGSLTSLDTLTVDTKKKTVKLNTSHAMKNSSRVFPELRPGSNSVVLTGEGTMTLKWRDCWL
jgi:phage-related protein